MKNLLAITAITSGAPRAPLVLRGDLVKAVGQAADWGYDAIEIHIIDAGDFPLPLMKDACSRYGVKVSAIVTGQIFTRRNRCITSPDPANREAAMAEVKAYIDIAAALGATDGVVIGWVKGNRPDTQQEEFDRLLAGQLRELGAYASNKGQRILVEVINRYETNLFNTAAELREFLDVPLKNYSSGMVARIAFAIATITKPDVLIADEILSVGDFMFQEKCEERMRQLMSGGTTVLLVSHSIGQIERMCDHVTWLEKGRVKMQGEAAEVCAAYKALDPEAAAIQNANSNKRIIEAP